MPRFPVVFLPGNLRPSNEGDRPLHKLSYVQLGALRETCGGDNFNARTPDPQARRFEFKNALLVELEKFNAGNPLSNYPSLAQFYALVEGLIFGHLRLRIFDLRVFKFAVPDHLRYFGVLLNHQGRALGGTDPDTLFFSAADALPADFAELERMNNDGRLANAGVLAGQLLRSFRQTLQPSWQPQNILWMRLLDLLFFNDALAGDVNLGGVANLGGIADNWKQVGPLTLCVSRTVGQENYRHFYFPVYEENYRHRVLMALSGNVAQVNGGLQLSVNGVPAGKILMPPPAAIGIQDPLLLGGGTLETQPINQQVPIHVNYSQLVPKIQGIVNRGVKDLPDITRHIAVESPFSYPDVIRIPVQYDGFVAAEALRPQLGISFGERFKTRMRGRGVYQPPPVPETLPNPPLIVRGGDTYYVDGSKSPRAVYVESYNNERVDELTGLGYVLWCIFDRQATVAGQHDVQMNSLQVLHYDGIRYELALSLQPNWPDFAAKVATLQRLKGALARPETGELFKAAVERWMSQGYQQERIVAHQSNPTRITLGEHTWYVDSN